MAGNVSQLGPEAPIVAKDGFAFRDLNKNAETPDGTTLPLRGTPRIYVENLDAEVAGEYGQVVDNIQDAVVDGGCPKAEGGPALRFGGPALPLRTRPHISGHAKGVSHAN
jgi:hypothetical protein